MWGLIYNTVVYNMLVFAHWINDDFSKLKYEKPLTLTNENWNDRRTLRMDVWPWNLWAVVHLAYEVCLVVNLVVTLMFWFIEAPIVLYNTSVSITPLAIFSIYIVHILPQLSVMLDWWHNSMEIKTTRLWFHLSVGSFYYLVAVWVTLNIKVFPDTVYESLNIHGQPELSLLMLFLGLFFVVVGLKVASFFNEKRLA